MKSILIIFGLSFICASAVAALLLFQQKNNLIQEMPLAQNQTEINADISNASSSESELYVIEVDWLNKLSPICIRNEECGDGYSEKYLAGKITNGKFNGSDLYLKAIGTMGGNDYAHYIILDGKEFILEENKFKIKGISDLPEKIDFPNSKYKLAKSYGPVELFSEVKVVKPLFAVNGLGEFVLADDGCAIIELPDHTALGYSLEISFLNKENGYLDIGFIDGKKNEEEYSYRKMSCGGACTFLQILEDKDGINPEERFIVVGTTSNGDKIFGLKDSQDIILKELYNNKSTYAHYYEGEVTQESKNKYSYQEFLDFHPLLYWQDPLGRWVEFKNERFDIVAEMCKPVIYLYPEKESRINVQVDPVDGFTKTIPEYSKNGWNVTAYPDGKIIDDVTGKTYDYLYWSGISFGQFRVDKGWVIKQDSLDSFFDEKLKILGMNEKEINDFKEYWVNRLTDSPYYRVSFLPRNIIDELAPLKISPEAPDFTLRVIMLVRGLDEYVEMPEQDLPPAPTRNGFAVVEWGGIYEK